jgi:hypothetical protein
MTECCDRHICRCKRRKPAGGSPNRAPASSDNQSRKVGTVTWISSGCCRPLYSRGSSYQKTTHNGTMGKVPPEVDQCETCRPRASAPSSLRGKQAVSNLMGVTTPLSKCLPTPAFRLAERSSQTHRAMNCGVLTCHVWFSPRSQRRWVDV